MKAYRKDIAKTIIKEGKRFISLIVIAALGVLMTTGLKASCDDTRESANSFYVKQNLRDLYIQSTLGLTEDDLATLSGVSGVDFAEGFYEETDYFSRDNARYSVLMTTCGERVDKPYVIEGNLPVKANEIAVTRDFSNKFGVTVGDTQTVDVIEDSVLTESEFVITAIVLNSTDINNPEGSTAFRSTATTDYVFYISKEAVDSEIYTGIAVSFAESKKVNTYTEEYRSLTENYINAVSKIKDIREAARTNAVKDEAYAEIADAEAEMYEEFDKAEAEINDALKKLADAKSELDANRMYVELGYITDEETIAQIESAWDEYNLAVEELEKNTREFETQKEEALREIQDAKDEVSDIEAAKWYVFTRDNLGGYTNVSSDMNAIDSLSLLFAIVFLLIAVLVSSITVNRLIEEHRGLIGTYQALGFTDGEIARKYLAYGLSAGIAGTALGEVLGYVVLPKIIFRIFGVMYTLPEFNLGVDVIRAIVAALAFILSILLTIAVSCKRAFKTMPAELMRPKAPKPGSKVLLESIPFIWNRFTFLNKVTARNIFRYKKRLLMTTIGILGCTSLLVCGFGIRDSVNHLLVYQYDEVINYDFMCIVPENDLDDYIDTIKEDADYMSFLLSSVSLKNSNDESIQTQIYVFEDDADFSKFMTLNKISDNEPLSIESDYVYITRNAGIMLDFSESDRVSIQDANFNQYEFTVGALVENYLANMIFMNRSTYEKTFGEYKPNAVMARSDKAVQLADSDYVKSSVVRTTLISEFTTSFALLNVIVWLLIGLSAALAFAVLFTLSSTNVSERERELATIKVLGFYDREVHLYINKEILILTLISVLLGLPAGSLLCGLLTDALKMPSLYFSVYIQPVSYFYSFVITMIFALLVSVIMHKTLDEIDPAEALKSIE